LTFLEQRAVLDCYVLFCFKNFCVS
jgi:hypothetical protein